jgi:hypothetical protein
MDFKLVLIKFVLANDVEEEYYYFNYCKANTKEQNNSACENIWNK